MKMRGYTETFSQNRPRTILAQLVKTAGVSLDHRDNNNNSTRDPAVSEFNDTRVSTKSPVLVTHIGITVAGAVVSRDNP